MFVIYPNPAVNVLNIKGMNAAKDYHLIIHDAKGNAVAETSVHNNSAYSWNIESISSGFYYLEIISDNRSSTIKFVKQ
jgi:hypothetical protein